MHHRHVEVSPRNLLPAIGLLLFCCACTPAHTPSPAALSQVQKQEKDLGKKEGRKQEVSGLYQHSKHIRFASLVGELIETLSPPLQIGDGEAAVDIAAVNPAVLECTIESYSEQPYQRAQLATGVSWIPRLSGYALLYYLPNRLLDLIDIFRFDLGVGVSYGAVARFTPQGQIGYRGFATPSFRMGPHGRYVPYFVERYDEYGIGPGFKSNRPRILSMTPAEVALSADVGLLGVYAGISFDEALDFILGILLIDFKGDDVVR